MRGLMLAGLIIIAMSGCTVSSVDTVERPAASAAASAGPVAQPSSAPSLAGPLVASYFSAELEYPGPVWTKSGRPVVAGELTMVSGSSHCGWESAVLLIVGWPLGTIAKTADKARVFVRDPRGVIDKGLSGGLSVHIRMPHDAQATGYHHGDLEFWLTPSDPNGAYLRVGDDVERWPAATFDVVCK